MIFVLVDAVIVALDATLALNVLKSVLLNKPAVVPVADADGIFNVIAGVEVAFETVDVNVLPSVVNVIGFTIVTEPPLPLAVKVPPLKLNPEPIVTSPGAADEELILPNNLVAAMSWIFA